jgi:hypothetical protein
MARLVCGPAMNGGLSNTASFFSIAAFKNAQIMRFRAHLMLICLRNLREPTKLQSSLRQHKNSQANSA